MVVARVAETGAGEVVPANNPRLDRRAGGRAPISKGAMAFAGQLFPTKKRRAENLLPCEVHQCLAKWCDQRGSNDVWSAVQVIKAHVTSKSAPSALARKYG